MDYFPLSLPSMRTLLRREFVVDVPVRQAWDHLARVERWPSWARHIKRIVLEPAGELTSRSRGLIHLRNGVRSRFEMTEFAPPRNWKWAGPFLWLKVHFDHRFDVVDNQRTRLVWIVEAEGFGVSFFGRLFAEIYARNLDRAIPNLISEMNALSPLSPSGRGSG